MKIINNRGYFVGIVEGDNRDGCDGSSFVDYFGVTFSNVYESYDIKVTINTGNADLNIAEKKISLENGLNCDYNDRQCFDNTYGSTFWSVGLDSSLCDKKKVFQIYEGPVTKVTETKDDNSTKVSYYNIDEKQIFYIDAGEQTILCCVTAFASQHPQIFITENIQPNSKFQRDENFSYKNIDYMILGGMKLSMMYNDIYTQMTKLYAVIQHQRCLSDSKIIANTLAVSQLDESRLGLSLFGTGGFFSRIRGEIAYILRCASVEIKMRTTKKCYNEIPIYYGNEEKFLTARTRSIVTEANEIPCDGFFQPAYKFGAGWFSMRHQGS